MVWQALQDFVGDITQAPPAYIAVKIGGKKAYRLARKGASVPLEPRRVTIDAIDLLSFNTPYLKIRVRCSTGTYIRAIARDLGTALGCGAYLQDLVRTAYGP
jgi:tRNA pseudouridine55 synthase